MHSTNECVNPRLELVMPEDILGACAVPYIFDPLETLKDRWRKSRGHRAFDRQRVLQKIGYRRIQANCRCVVHRRAEPYERNTQTNLPAVLASRVFDFRSGGFRSWRCCGRRVRWGGQRGGRGESFDRRGRERIRQARGSSKGPNGIVGRCRCEARSGSARKVHGRVFVHLRRRRDFVRRPSRTRSRKQQHRHGKELLHSSLLENRRPEPGQGLPVTVNKRRPSCPRSFAKRLQESDCRRFLLSGIHARGGKVVLAVIGRGAGSHRSCSASLRVAG
jgi:hypothetical protein